MPLVQKLVNNIEYYTDDEVYYTFHEVKADADTLWSFACRDFSLTGNTYFTSHETKSVTDLAGIGPLHPTRFLILKNGAAMPVPYRADGSADLHPGDIILRFAADPHTRQDAPGS